MIATEWIKWDWDELGIRPGGRVLVKHADGRIAGPCLARALVWDSEDPRIQIVEYFQLPDDTPLPSAPKPVNKGLMAMNGHVRALIDSVDFLFANNAEDHYVQRITKVDRQLRKLLKEIEEDLG